MAAGIREGQTARWTMTGLVTVINGE